MIVGWPLGDLRILAAKKLAFFDRALLAELPFYAEGSRCRCWKYDSILIYLHRTMGLDVHGTLRRFARQRRADRL